MFLEHKEAVEITKPMSNEKRTMLLAAEVLERQGWCGQIPKEGDKGPQCILGAVLIAARSVGIDGNDACNYLRRFFPIGPMPSIWNDMRGRTKEEVIAKLRAVALEGSSR